MLDYLWVSIIFLLAGFIQGLSGFGSVLISIPLLSIFLDIKTVIPLVALAGFSITIVLLVQLRHHFEWHKVYPLLIGALAGIPIGVLFLKNADKTVIQLVLGIILMLYALFGLLSKPPKKGLHDGWAYPFGFIAGYLGGAFGAAGPAVIVYTSLKAWNKDRIKVTLQGFFVFSGAVVVFFHALNGLTTAQVLKYFGGSIPMFLMGIYLGSMLYGAIKEVHYRKFMLILLAILGAWMSYRA